MGSRRRQARFTIDFVASRGVGFRCLFTPEAWIPSEGKKMVLTQFRHMNCSLAKQLFKRDALISPTAPGVCHDKCRRQFGARMSQQCGETCARAPITSAQRAVRFRKVRANTGLTPSNAA